jgi:hypothetical protein
MLKENTSEINKFDVNHELDQCINLIKKVWNFSNLSWRVHSNEEIAAFFIKTAFHRGLNSAKNWIEPSRSNLSSTLRSRFESLKSQGIPEEMHLSDGTAMLLYSLILKAGDLTRSCEIDINATMLDVQNLIAMRIKGSVNIKPNNYDEWVIQHESDEDNLILRNHTLKKLLSEDFKGCNASAHGITNFVGSITPLHVLQDKMQGISSNKSLLISIHAQSMYIQLNNNIHQLNNELKTLDMKKPFYNTAHENHGELISSIIESDLHIIPHPIRISMARYLNPLTPRNNDDMFNIN